MVTGKYPGNIPGITVHVRDDLLDIRTGKVVWWCFCFFLTSYLLRCLTAVQRVYRFELFIFTEWQSIKTPP